MMTRHWFAPFFRLAPVFVWRPDNLNWGLIYPENESQFLSLYFLYDLTFLVTFIDLYSQYNYCLQMFHRMFALIWPTYTGSM